MRRPARIAFRALAIFIVLSCVIAIVMAELTLHVMRLPPPDGSRIAAMYALYGADVQPVVLEAADGAELHGWYSVPEHQNGQAVILFMESAITVVALRVMVRCSSGKAIAF